MKNSTLYKLCSQNNWFTHGTSLQYRRMFDLNADGVLKLNKSDYALDALARIIWICSDESISYGQYQRYSFRRRKRRNEP